MQFLFLFTTLFHLILLLTFLSTFHLYAFLLFHGNSSKSERQSGVHKLYFWHLLVSGLSFCCFKINQLPEPPANKCRPCSLCFWHRGHLLPKTCSNTFCFKASERTLELIKLYDRLHVGLMQMMITLPVILLEDLISCKSSVCVDINWWTINVLWSTSNHLQPHYVHFAAVH